MKKIFLFAILLSALSANSQKLLDALYSGKLKTDSGTVIRKGDDLTSKIDTSTKKPVVVEKPKFNAQNRDSLAAALIAQGDSSSALVIMQNDSVANTGTAPAETPNATKDNNAIWKDYIEELTTTLRTEVMTSKKIKGGTYSVLIEYEIGVDGQIAVNNVSSSPESSFLDQQIKERLTLTAPQMTPLLNNFGKPRKAAKKQILTLSK